MSENTPTRAALTQTQLSAATPLSVGRWSRWQQKLVAAAWAATRVGNACQGLATIFGLGLISYQLLQVNQSNSQTALATVYAQQNELSRFLADKGNSHLRDHFYKDDEQVALSAHQDRLRELLENATPETRAQLQMVSETFANCFECVYQMRQTLPDGDWNTWWASFQDTYDESPALQRFYERRRTWYELSEYLRIEDVVTRNESLRH